MKINFKNKEGFTLIELLVVVAIIGMLASLILASLNSARTKARDSRRLSDLKEIANLITVNETSPEGAIGCSGNVNNCSSVTGLEALSRFKDPSGATTVCSANPNGVCQYALSRASGSGNPTYGNWKVCSYAEKSAGSARSNAGPISISSNDLSVHAGCN